MKEIIDYINTQINALNIFTKLLGLAEILTTEDNEENVVKYPVIYISNDELDKIDVEGSKVYHRQNGDLSISENGTQPNGCERYLDYTFPMKMVALVDRNEFEDCNYTPINLMTTLSNTVNINNVDGTAQGLNGGSFSIVVTGGSTDRQEIFDAEYSNSGKLPDFKIAYVSLEYNIIWTGNQSCFEGVCD